MTSASENSEHQSPSRLRRFFRSRMSPLVVFIVVSLLLKENYPISDYPMYSGISSASYYFYVADGEGNPIPTRENFGKSASAIKKMHGAHMNEIADEKGVRAYQLPWEDQVRAGSALLAQLRERGESRGYWKRNKPESVRLLRVDITRDSSGIVKDEKLVVEEPASP